MCHATSFMRTRDLWCNRLGKVSNFTGSIALFSILSANLRFLTFLVLKFWFRALENVKWKSRNFVGFVSLTGWWAVTINESLPFGISLPLPALSSPVSRIPPAPCSPGLPPPCPPPLRSSPARKICLFFPNYPYIALFRLFTNPRKNWRFPNCAWESILLNCTRITLLFFSYCQILIYLI